MLIIPGIEDIMYLYWTGISFQWGMVDLLLRAVAKSGIYESPIFRASRLVKRDPGVFGGPWWVNLRRRMWDI